MAKQLSSLSVKELTDLNRKLRSEWDALSRKKLEIQAELDERAAEESAKAKLAAMSDAERVALAQVIEARGIESEEVVGKPG